MDASPSGSSSPSQIAERREAVRHAIEAPVRMQLEAQCLEGLSDNLSHIGIMFFTEDPVRVKIDVEHPEGTRTYTGRLVRVQRMNETNTGLAIEFDA